MGGAQANHEAFPQFNSNYVTYFRFMKEWCASGRGIEMCLPSGCWKKNGWGEGAGYGCDIEDLTEVWQILGVCYPGYQDIFFRTQTGQRAKGPLLRRVWTEKQDIWNLAIMIHQQNVEVKKRCR
jgi:hypothetical protein